MKVFVSSEEGNYIEIDTEDPELKGSLVSVSLIDEVVGEERELPKGWYKITTVEIAYYDPSA